MKSNTKKFIYRVTALVVLIFVAFGVLWGSGSVAPVAYADDTYLQMDDTAVLDDLNGVTVNGKPFSTSDYGANPLQKTQLLTFVEYSYSYYGNLRGNYALYLYVWNPKKIDYVELSMLNKVSLRFGGSESASYTKYPLVFLNGSEDGLYLKFRVSLTAEDKETIFKTLDSAKRIYEISEIELLENGKTNATSTTVGMKYTYTGYAAGFGESSTVSTLGMSAEQTDVVETEPHYTFYRYPRSETKKTQVNSVYFSMDSSYEFLEQFSTLYAIEAEYYKYLTSPIVVTNNKDFYDAQQDWIGVDIGKDGDANNQWAMYSDHAVIHPLAQLFMPGGWLWGIWREAGFAYNHASFPWNISVSDDAVFMTKIPYLFYTDGVDNNDYVLERDKLEEWWKDYTEDIGAGTNNLHGYNNDLFMPYDLDGDGKTDDPYNRVLITKDDKFDLPGTDYGSWFMNWWKGLWGDTYPAIEDIEPIVEVQDEDVNSVGSIEDDLLIDESAVDEFKSFYAAEKAKDKRVYLFRFDVTEYSAEDITVDKHGITAWDQSSTDLRQGFVYQGFDLLNFTFVDDYGNQKIVGVASSPIDGVADFGPPDKSPWEEFWNGDGDGPSWWKIVLGILLVVVLIVLIGAFFPGILQVIIWVIALPFKALFALFKAIGSMFKRDKNKKKE